jgi:hypothetical protein
MTHQHQEEEGQVGGKVVVEVIEVEIIEIEVYAREGRPVPRGKHYRIRVDKEHFVVRQPMITREEILALVDKRPQLYQVYQHVRGGQTKIIKSGEHVDLTEPGIERFTTLKIENTEGSFA